MVDEQEPPKRVVKRVVKKTVVRPRAPSEAPPTVRYGRPVATATKPKAKVSPARPGKAPAPERQRVDFSARLGTAGHRIADAWWVVADTVREGSGATRRATAARARAVAGWRLPHLNLHLAALITGAAVGLTAVGLGAASLQLFNATRNVSTGGGFWGGLTVIVIGVLCACLGSLLLAGFGSPTARLTSILGVIVTAVAIMGLFLDQSQTNAAVLLIPALAATSYVLAHWLLTLAEENT